VPDALKGFAEVSSTSYLIVDLLRPFDAHLNALNAMRRKLLRLFPRDQSAVGEQIDSTPAASDFFENIKEIGAQKGLTAGNIVAQGKREIIGILPGLYHLLDFADNATDLRKGDFLFAGPRLVTVRASQVTPLSKVPLNEKIKWLAGKHK
jgi:hypothetical protein